MRFAIDICSTSGKMSEMKRNVKIQERNDLSGKTPTPTNTLRAVTKRNTRLSKKSSRYNTLKSLEVGLFIPFLKIQHIVFNVFSQASEINSMTVTSLRQSNN